MSEHFELRFEGPGDESPRTLQLIKGVFVADLEFPVSDVQRFLQSAPIAIKSAASQSELKKEFDLLSKAGAKVLIVQVKNEGTLKPEPTPAAIPAPEPSDTKAARQTPKSEPAPATTAPNDLELAPLSLEYDQVLNTAPTEVLPVQMTSTESLELNFDFTSSPAPQEPSATIAASAPVDSSFDEPNELTLNFSLDGNSETPTPKEAKPAPAVAGSKTIDAPSSSDFDLTLALDEPTPAPAPEKPRATPSAEKEEPKALTEMPLISGESANDGPVLEVFAPSHSTLFKPVDESVEPSGVQAEPQAPKVATEQVQEIVAAVDEPLPETVSEDSPATNANRTESNEDQVIELTAAELKKLQRGPRKKLKVGPAHTLIAVGLVLMFFINQEIFNAPPGENPFAALVEQLPSMNADETQNQQERLAKKAAELERSAWYSAEENFPDRSVKASVWVEDGALIHGTVEVTTPKPAPLSKEELVQRVPPRPWLRRLEMKDLTFKKEAGAFHANGPVLAYVTVGEKNLRFAGLGSLKASLSEDKKTISIEASAAKPEAPTDLSPHLIFSFESEAVQSLNFFQELKLGRQ